MKTIPKGCVLQMPELARRLQKGEIQARQTPFSFQLPFVKYILSSRWGMLNLVNQLFKIYFKLNKLHLTKPLIRAVDSSPLRDKYEYHTTPNIRSCHVFVPGSQSPSW